MIGVKKSALSEVIGNAMLTFEELEDIFLDVECFMNDRPLVYTGEFDQPTITPNILIRGERNTYLEENIDAVNEQADVTRQLNFITRCREQLRKRWLKEYLRALNERKQQVARPGGNKLSDGREVLIKDSVKVKGNWRLGRVEGSIV